MPPKYETGSNRIQFQVQLEQVAAKLIVEIGAQIGAGMRATLLEGERVAVNKAPIRKLFKGGRQTFIHVSALSIEEQRRFKVQAARAGIYHVPLGIVTRRNQANTYRNTQQNRVAVIQTREIDPATGRRMRFSAEGLGATVDRQGHATRHESIHGEHHQIQLQDVGSERYLSARGMFEVRSGRALTNAGEVGGFLRQSMGISDLTLHGKKFYGSVRNTASYARYVEFGTRRSRAQPFLRPAMAYLERFFPREMRRALLKVGRAG